MPELPEAETIARSLNELLTGRSIVNVEVFTPAMRTSLLPLKTAGLEGRAFVGVRRRGRYLIGDLDDRRCLLMHLGMSGVIRVEGADIAKRKHEHVFLHLSDGKIFRFECTRRFSMLEVHDCPAGVWPAVLDKLGVEPLADEFSPEFMVKAARGKTGCVKNFIMDNGVVVGIGNIYAAETLFAAGVSPLRRACDVTGKEWKTIVGNAKRILKRSIEVGGSTISDFLHVDGSKGEFVNEIKIYGREGKPCPKCGTAVECVRLGGRSSCYCPKCQK